MPRLKMATTGYDCSFVDRASRPFECCVCLLLLREPHLVSCCGSHFCHGCIDQVRRAGGPCPFCAESQFSSMRNKGMEREMKQMRVWCTHHERGCEWSGELGKLEAHTNLQSGDCRYVEVECAWGCGAKMERRFYQEHEAKSCQKHTLYMRFEDENLRMLAERLECLGAENEALRNEMVDLRRAVETIQSENLILREEVEELRSRQTPPAVAELNRGVESIREENAHLKQEIETLKSQRENMFSRLESLTAQMDSLKQRTELSKSTPSTSSGAEVRDWVQVSPTPFIPSSSGSDDVAIVPFSFTLTNFKLRKKNNAEWYSPPFYSDDSGYKMCIRVDANGTVDGRNTHISVYAYLMRGAYDSELQWPFRGVVVVQLLNQCRNGGHYEKTIDFPETLDKQIGSRVTFGDKAVRGQGYSQFIAHIDLGYNPTLNTQYMKDNCLNFVVIGVEQRSLSSSGGRKTSLLKWFGK